MKSQVHRTKIDQLTFHWDHKASRSSHKKRGIHTDCDKKRNLDKYFDMLDELKPHKQELRHTKIYKEPFTLGPLRGVVD